MDWLATAAGRDIGRGLPDGGPLGSVRVHVLAAMLVAVEMAVCGAVGVDVPVLVPSGRR